MAFVVASIWNKMGSMKIVAVKEAGSIMAAWQLWYSSPLLDLTIQ